MEVYARDKNQVYLSEGFDTTEKPIWVTVALVDVPGDVAAAFVYTGPTVLDLIPPGFVDVFDSWDDYSLQNDAEVNHGC